MGCSPVPRAIFLGEIIEESSEFGKILNEPMVKVGETKEPVEVAEVVRCGPLGDGMDFDGVHRDLTLVDDESKILYLVLGKLAFL